ncbi:MAG: hypothetical protein NZ841_00990 [Dictyoglomus sp.]|nr:hypothetical protein [Dictyoglomus sp.]MCX7941516.1 hypothetical protein [Dictyoglomaceae bacterium]MDW8187864.1 hypothetical protein [Dictyoglomus sp.]
MFYQKYSLHENFFSEFKKGNFIIRKLSINSPFEGETEVHKYINDVYVVYSGRARVILSKEYWGGKEIDIGEIRGCEIKDYKEEVISEGDLLFISAGTAHKLLVEDGSFILLIIKIPE